MGAPTMLVTGQGGHEQRERPRPLPLPKPVCEVQNDAWEIPGFRQTQQET